MSGLFGIINKPLGWVLESIASLMGGNFAAAVFIFTLLINLALVPLSIKSQKSSVQQTRIRPKLDDIKKRYGDDRQKYSEATQKLYQEEGVSMSGGCLPMILRLVLMMSIYYLILSPLTYLMHIDAEVIKDAAEAIKTTAAASRSNELLIIEAVKSGKIADQFPQIAERINDIDFSFFGIDLTQTPKFSFDIFHKAEPIWFMPVLAFGAQMLSSVLSMKMQKKINPDAPSMAGMMLTMPLISLFIGFGLPGGVAFYWACSSLIGGFIQLGVQAFYGPHRMLSHEREKELMQQYKFEAGQIEKISAKENKED